MVQASKPLLTVTGIDDFEHALSSGQFVHASFEITKTGKAVTAGKEDFVELNGIDLWLGGVYLNDKQEVARWDEKSQRIRP
jgi:hypothetical protein